MISFEEVRQFGAQLGMLGILHTWSRTLTFHPHVHYLIPGGGLSPDHRQWIASRPNFLFPEKPLARHFRLLFYQHLDKLAPEALDQLPSKIWKQNWAVRSFPAAVGVGVAIGIGIVPGYSVHIRLLLDLTKSHAHPFDPDPDPDSDSDADLNQFCANDRGQARRAVAFDLEPQPSPAVACTTLVRF